MISKKSHSLPEGFSEKFQVLRWIMPFHLMWQLRMGGHLYESAAARKAGHLGTAVKELCFAFVIPILMHGINDYLAIEATNLSAHMTKETPPAAEITILLLFLVWILGMAVYTILTENWAAAYVKQSRQTAEKAEQS